jgi:hypothetical protein
MIGRKSKDYAVAKITVFYIKIAAVPEIINID